jgi:hypothetical protein
MAWRILSAVAHDDCSRARPNAFVGRSGENYNLSMHSDSSWLDAAGRLLIAICFVGGLLLLLENLR